MATEKQIAAKPGEYHYAPYPATLRIGMAIEFSDNNLRWPNRNGNIAGRRVAREYWLLRH
jgi:hypothetical protein